MDAAAVDETDAAQLDAAATGASGTDEGAAGPDSGAEAPEGAEVDLADGAAEEPNASPGEEPGNGIADASLQPGSSGAEEGAADPDSGAEPPEGAEADLADGAAEGPNASPGEEPGDGIADASLQLQSSRRSHQFRLCSTLFSDVILS